MKGWWIGVAGCLLAAGCNPSNCAHAACAATGVYVNVEALPRAWQENGRFTLCEEGRCTTEEAPFGKFYSRGPFLDRSQSVPQARDVALRVVVAGRTVVDIHSRSAFTADPVAKGEICEVCGGSARLHVTADGKTLVQD